MVVGVDRHHARLVGGLVALADVGGDAEDGERLRPPLRRLHTQGAQRCLDGGFQQHRQARHSYDENQLLQVKMQRDSRLGAIDDMDAEGSVQAAPEMTGEMMTERRGSEFTSGAPAVATRGAGVDPVLTRAVLMFWWRAKHHNKLMVTL